MTPRKSRRVYVYRIAAGLEPTQPGDESSFLDTVMVARVISIIVCGDQSPPSTTALGFVERFKSLPSGQRHEAPKTGTVGTGRSRIRRRLSATRRRHATRPAT